jgi:hypothetical protein
MLLLPPPPPPPPPQALLPPPLFFEPQIRAAKNSSLLQPSTSSHLPLFNSTPPCPCRKTDAPAPTACPTAKRGSSSPPFWSLACRRVTLQSLSTLLLAARFATAYCCCLTRCWHCRAGVVRSGSDSPEEQRNFHHADIHGRCRFVSLMVGIWLLAQPRLRQRRLHRRI